MHFELLLVAALRLQDAGGIGNSAVDHAVIGIENGSVFVGAHTNLGALRGAALGEVLSAEGGVGPGYRCPVKGIAENVAFGGTVTDIREQETGLANFFAGRSGGERQPDQRHFVEAEVGVDQCDGFIQADAGARSEHLPSGPLLIADGDPGAVHDENVVGVAFDVAGFKIQRILGDHHHRVGAAEYFDGAANVFEGANAGGEVEVRFGGFEVLVFVVELHVALGERIAGGVVIFDVIGTQPHAGILQIDIFVGDEEVALVSLRAFRGKLGVLAFAGRQTHLLRAALHWKENQKSGEKRE